MKRKEEFIDWSKLEGLMDKIYTLVEIDNEHKSLDSFVGYLLKKSKPDYLVEKPEEILNVIKNIR